MGLRQIRKHGLALDGWLVLDKHVGLRSTVAVARVQSLLRARKCGHAGTLDPAAEGLLPLALGAATKTVSYAMDGTKVYDMVVRWGERSTTDDKEGEIEASSDARPSRADIESLLPEFTGEIMQRPPRFSALRIGGKRAYTLARQGEEVCLEPRKVRIFSLSLVEVLDEDRARFSVEAGKGAYMRAIARDLGERLGCFGRLQSLRRSRVGTFTEEQSVSLEKLEALFDKPPAIENTSEKETSEKDIGEDAPAPLSREETFSRLGDLLLPVESALGAMPRLTLERWEQQQFCRGLGVLFAQAEQRERLAEINFAEINLADINVSSADSIAVFSSVPESRLLGVGNLQQGRLKALRLFAPHRQGASGGRGGGGGGGGRGGGRGVLPQSHEGVAGDKNPEIDHRDFSVRKNVAPSPNTL